jgi:uncharacterized protein (DUF4415 family)
MAINRQFGHQLGAAEKSTKKPAVKPAVVEKVQGQRHRTPKPAKAEAAAIAHFAPAFPLDESRKRTAAKAKADAVVLPRLPYNPAPTVNRAAPVSAPRPLIEHPVSNPQRVGTTPVKLRIPNDILATFKATGAGWQTRMVIALRRAMSDVQYPTA